MALRSKLIMCIYRLEKKLRLPISVDQAWQFFSNPRNLSTITPKAMNFVIKSPVSDPVYAGMMITYTVSPLLNIPMTWVTEITHVREPYYFCDEQRMGPYRLWHHEHFLKPIEGGVEMTDIVNYSLKLPLFDFIIHPLIVRPQLEKIFAYREEVLNKTFGKLASR